MKIAYVFMGFPGGRETFAGTEIRAVRAHGAAVSVHVLRPKPRGAESLLEQWRLADLPVHWVGLRQVLAGLLFGSRHPLWTVHLLVTVVADNWRWPLHVLRSLVLLPSVLSTYRELRSSDPDVVHLFWGHYPSMLGILIARCSPNWVLTMFLGAYDLNRRYPSSLTCARSAATVFTHAETNRAALLSLGIDGEKIERVYRGVDLAVVTAAAGAARIPGRVVSVGALTREKGMHHVLKAFSILQKDVPDASLTLVGDGPERESLMDTVEKSGLRNVEFRGFLPHLKVVQELAQAEAFLFLSTSEDERLPNVAKEAIGAGCVCVLSRTPGIDELVSDGASGFLVDAEDHAGAAAALGRVLRGEVDRAQIVRRGRERLAEAFDASVTSARYLAVWERSLRSQAPLGTSGGRRRSECAE